MQEIWKDIENYEGYYQISNFGRVKSLDRYVNNSSLRGYIKQAFISGKLLNTQKITKNGYSYVSICKDGISKDFLIHRLVAHHFVKNIDNKKQVNHIDSDVQNNYYTNLEWVTQSENVKHAYKSGTMNNIRKSIKCIETGEVFNSIRSASKVLGVADTTIGNALKDKRKIKNMYTVEEV